MELENLLTTAEEPASISVAGAFERGGSIRFEGDSAIGFQIQLCGTHGFKLFPLPLRTDLDGC